MPATMACRKCRKLFNSMFGSDVCPECAKTEEDSFERVRDYLWEHKGAHVPEVAQACDVTEKDIMRWLREDRIQVCEGSVIKLYCEKCGKQILGGRFCEECVMQMHGVFSDIEKKARQNEADKRSAKIDYIKNHKMRFMGSEQK